MKRTLLITSFIILFSTIATAAPITTSPDVNVPPGCHAVACGNGMGGINGTIEHLIKNGLTVISIHIVSDVSAIIIYK